MEGTICTTVSVYICKDARYHTLVVKVAVKNSLLHSRHRTRIASMHGEFSCQIGWSMCSLCACAVFEACHRHPTTLPTFRVCAPKA